MYTVTCEECGKKFTKPRRVHAEQALRMHTGRAHSGIIRNRHEHSNNGESSLAVAVMPVNGVAKIDRRTKAWRDANPRLASRIGRRVKAQVGEADTSRVCFCPRCGLDLVRVEVGMRVATNFQA